MKILIVDDEKMIVEVLKEYAEFEGFEVDVAFNGEDALIKATKEDFDCIVMDIMMPKLDGFALIKEIRKIKDTPSIIMSARNTEFDKLHGFELGADDYVVKPFSPKEVIARTKAVVKRTKKESDFLNIGMIHIDYTAHKVFIDKKEIDLNAKEFELLSFFMKNEGVVFSREKLLDKVWGFDYSGFDRTVDAHIKLLRASLGEASKYIKTIHGVGYKFEKVD